MRRPAYAFSIVALLFSAAAATAQVDSGCEYEWVEATLTITAMGEFEIAGDLAGDLEGTFDSDIIETTLYELPWGTATLLQTESTIATLDGEITTAGGIVLFPLGPTGNTLWFGKHCITGGTGAFEGAEGMFGTFGFFPTGELPVLDFGGIICFPPP